MDRTRRAVLAGLAGAAVTAAPAAAQATAVREFRVLRGGTDIGRHRIALARQGRDVTVDIDIELVVRVLGIAAYRYTMTNREVWRDGLLMSGDSRVNDDGRRKRVVSRREGGALRVESPDFTGSPPEPLATTTYFTTAFLERPSWMSTDSGEIYAVQRQRAGASTVQGPQGPVACTRWTVSGGKDFRVALHYDARGEWMAVDFDAGGEPATYRPLSTADRLAAVWAG
jgi:hypothetical protein